MYYIIHKQLWNVRFERFYLISFDEKKKLATYNPHVEDAKKFNTAEEALFFIANVPSTIRIEMMIVPEF